MDYKFLQKCREGDKASLSTLYQTYKTHWYMICLRYVKSSYNAEDILQNGLIKIFQNMHSFDPSKGEFKSWSNKIIVNESIQFLRNQKQSLNFEEINDAVHFEDEQIQKSEVIDAESLTKLIQSLPEGYRLVFNLYAIEGMTHAEIGQILNIKESTSKSQYFKAKRLLKKQLEVII